MAVSFFLLTISSPSRLVQKKSYWREQGEQISFKYYKYLVIMIGTVVTASLLKIDDAIAMTIIPILTIAIFSLFMKQGTR